MISIYTDGALLQSKGNAGGWAAVLVYKTGEPVILSGSEYATTNNRMEMMAALAALSHLKRPKKVEIVSDSKYLVESLSQWMHNWARWDFNPPGKEIKNLDLWLRLYDLYYFHTVTVRWVKGHAGDHYNELADHHAGIQAAECKPRKKEFVI